MFVYAVLMDETGNLCYVVGLEKRGESTKYGEGHHVWGKPCSLCTTQDMSSYVLRELGQGP